MPNLKKMKATMEKLGIAPEIIEQMNLEADQSGVNSQNVFGEIDKMDKLLTEEQCLAVMQEQGCCKGGKRDKDCKAFGKEHKDMPFDEKLALLFTVENMVSPQLSDDGSFTITWGTGYKNGVHTGNTTCSCGAVKKLKQPFTVSPTYCGCCAGHFMYHYQNALKVKLRLKKINSSPLNTNGDEPCSFTFEVVE